MEVCNDDTVMLLHTDDCSNIQTSCFAQLSRVNTHWQGMSNLAQFKIHMLQLGYKESHICLSLSSFLAERDNTITKGFGKRPQVDWCIVKTGFYLFSYTYTVHDLTPPYKTNKIQSFKNTWIFILLKW